MSAPDITIKILINILFRNVFPRIFSPFNKVMATNLAKKENFQRLIDSTISLHTQFH